MHPTCEHCKKKLATVHLTEIVDKVPRESHLCEDCAQELGVGGKPKPIVSIADLIGSLTEPKSIRCPRCGIAFHEFRMKGRLGCAHDYEVFAQGLDPLIERIHGVSPPAHRGKVPAGARALQEARRQQEALEEELNQAVRDEEYERAAEIRDRLRDLSERIEMLETEAEEARESTDESA